MKIGFDASHKKKPWVLYVGTFHGRRQREYFETEPKAEQRVKDLQSLEKIRGKQALRLSDAKRVELMAADDKAAALGTTVMHCVLYYESNHKPVKATTMEVATALFLDAKRNSGKRPEYLKKLTTNFNKLTKHSGNEHVHKVDSKTVEEWARIGAKSLHTVKSRLIDAQTFFNYAIRQGWCLTNPVAKLERIQLEDTPPGIHTVEQVATIMNLALEHDRSIIGYLACCYFGGLRPAESASLSKEQVHADVIEVTGAKSKTRRRRFVPINDTLRAWLDVSGCKVGMSKRSRQWERLRWIAGGRKMEADGNRNLRVVTGFPWPHDVMRHSFCSYALPRYGATETAAMAGHSEQILFRHYRERVKPSEAAEYWKILPK